MKEASTLETKAAADLPPIRIKLRTRLLGTAGHHAPPRTTRSGTPFIIRLKDQKLRVADDASLATQFAF